MTVDIAKSWDLALERTIEILSKQYDDTLIARFGVDSSRLDADGIYLPPVTRWYRQAAPSRAQLLKPAHHVAGFIGPSSESRYSDVVAILDGGYGAVVQLPFAISIYFSDALGRDVVDPSQPGQVLDVEEIMLKRALRYLGALIETLTRYGCHSEGIADVTPLSDFALGGEIDTVDQDGRTLRGVVMSEVLLAQEIIFPPQTPLP